MEAKIIFLFFWAIALEIFAPVTVAIGQTSLFVSSSKTFHIKGTTLTANGHITNNGTISTTSASVLNLNGTSTQNLNGSAVNGTAFGRININNTNGVSLGTNVDVTGTTGLDFTLGALTLNGSSIRFGVGSTWASNNTTTKFFITNGIGLVYANSGAAPITYPVGTATGAGNYTPITISNSGTVDNIGARVQPNFRTAYSSTDGSAMGSAVVAYVVPLTWVVNESSAGGSILTVTPQWNSANESVTFVRSVSMVGYYNYAVPGWITNSWGGATGSNPYTKTATVSGWNLSYMPVVIGGLLSPLPIELLGFDASSNKADAIITWSTASETNNDFFELERSADAVNFKKIAVKPASGNSSSVKYYDYTDQSVSELAEEGQLYYRLKQVDFDGHYTYSPIRSVRFDGQVNDLVLYPNPVKEALNIVYSSAYNCELVISVVNALGISVKQLTVPVNKGSNTILLHLDELVNASYTVLITSPSGIDARKIIIAR